MNTELDPFVWKRKEMARRGGMPSDGETVDVPVVPTPVEDAAAEDAKKENSP